KADLGVVVNFNIRQPANGIEQGSTASIDAGLLDLLFRKLLGVIGSSFIGSHQFINLGGLVCCVYTVDLHVAVLRIMNIGITRNRHGGGARAIVRHADNHYGVGVFFAIINTGVKCRKFIIRQTVAVCVGAGV